LCLVWPSLPWNRNLVFLNKPDCCCIWKDALDKTKGLLLQPHPPLLVWHKQSKCKWVGFPPSIKLSQSVWDGGPILRANLIHLRANAYFHIYPKHDNLLTICYLYVTTPQKRNPELGLHVCHVMRLAPGKIIKYIFMTPCINVRATVNQQSPAHQFVMLGGWTRNFFQFPT
jgi:hypothetical protein